MNFSLEKIIKLLRKNFLIIMAVALLFSAFMYYYKKNNTVPVYTAIRSFTLTRFTRRTALHPPISTQRETMFLPT